MSEFLRGNNINPFLLQDLRSEVKPEDFSQRVADDYRAALDCVSNLHDRAGIFYLYGMHYFSLGQAEVQSAVEAANDIINPSGEDHNTEAWRMFTTIASPHFTAENMRIEGMVSYHNSLLSTMCSIVDDDLARLQRRRAEAVSPKRHGISYVRECIMAGAPTGSITLDAIFCNMRQALLENPPDRIGYLATGWRRQHAIGDFYPHFYPPQFIEAAKETGTLARFRYLPHSYTKNSTAGSGDTASVVTGRMWNSSLGSLFVSSIPPGGWQLPALQASLSAKYNDRAHVYEAVYGGKKNYEEEAGVLDGLVREHKPDARTWLDVGCGTGLHLQFLKKAGYEVAGIDADPALLRRARERLGSLATLHVANMETFDISRKFDVVSSLFGVSAYAKGKKGLKNLVARMVSHASEGGIVVLEPWVGRERALLSNGGTTIYDETLTEDGLLTKRVSDYRDIYDKGQSESVYKLLYAIDGLDPPIVAEEPPVTLQLFDLGDYRVALQAAGCSNIICLPELPGLKSGYNRGLYIATAP